jgi:hypothetical protein
MTAATSLPHRPSLESLRKQAKRLAREIAGGDAAAIARARAQLPNVDLPLTQRTAQLVIAREYGYAGWQDLTAEVRKRLGTGLEWAVAQARRVIHDNDVERLKQLLADYPALLSWRVDEGDGGLLGMATGSFGDAGDAFREEHFTRRACAEVLLDAGVVVAPAVCDGLLQSRAQGLIDLFHRRGLLPRSLKFLAALGDVDGVRARLDTNADDLATLSEAFMYACHLRQPTAAEPLLDRVIALDPELGRRIDGGPGRVAFVQSFIANKPDVHDPDPFRPWQAFVMQRIGIALRDGDLPAFVDGLRRDPWLLSDALVKFQVGLVEGTAATLHDRAAFLAALLDLDPAVLHCALPPPPTIGPPTSHPRAFVHAFTYTQTQVIPMLLRIWPMPDDLPHAAGNGDFPRVKRWFDAAGRPALGDLANHFPAHDDWIRGNLNWGVPTVQQVLDTALAFAVMNNHFEIADFLLAHGADVNTTWSSHEPASILHELVWHKNYEAMQFLIDRGIDLTIKDYRWHGTAQGWAFHAAEDEMMAQWLEAAERQRDRPAR